MFYYFYFFYFCSHWSGMMLINKLLQKISDQSPVNPVFFYSLCCDDVCVAWWKRGKVWWCNTLWGWMLHTLFLSLLLLKRSVCLLFQLVLLWCLRFILVSIDKVETEHYRFLTKCCFAFLGVGYAMPAWLESLLYEVKHHSKIQFKPFLFPA